MRHYMFKLVLNQLQKVSFQFYQTLEPHLLFRGLLQLPVTPMAIPTVLFAIAGVSLTPLLTITILVYFCFSS